MFYAFASRRRAFPFAWKLMAWYLATSQAAADGLTLGATPSELVALCVEVLYQRVTWLDVRACFAARQRPATPAPFACDRATGWLPGPGRLRHPHGMTDRDALHALLDTLPDEDLPRAAEALRGVVGDGFDLTPELEAGVEAGLRSAREGRVVSLDEAHARMTAKLSALR